MSETRRTLGCPPARPELEALLERARNHVMTPEEKRAQRRSWVIGEMMLERPEMTREYVEKLLDEMGA
jgi:hypothetical protein